jgi:high affinity Mn2+ porin
VAGVNAQDGQFGPLGAGLQAGYRYVTPLGVMFGVEATLSFPDQMNGNPPTAVSALQTSSIADEVDIFGALSGRLGYAFGNWLFYGIGGFAYDRDLATGVDTNGQAQSSYFWRRGWLAGAGVEAALDRNWSARLEYSHYGFGRADMGLPSFGDPYRSELALDTVQLGLNYRFSDPNMRFPSNPGGLVNLADWSIHGQSTLIGMTNGPFSAAYTGPSSLYAGPQTRETFSASGYLGYRLWEGTEVYYNPETFQGFGLSGTHGVAAFPDNEAQKVGHDFPYYRTSRLFLRETIGFGGEQEDFEDGPNQVAGKPDISRLTVTLGKLSIPDLFDNNAYAHDARTSFMNYALVDAGTLDYAGDQTGFSWGGVAELNQKSWAFRAGYFLVPKIPNANEFDMALFARGEYIVEFEGRYTAFGHAGKIRLTGWDSQCFCGSFEATLASPYLTNPALDPDAPDIAATRKTRSEYGGIINLEQSLTDDLGMFARLGWRNGQTEVLQFTDADRSGSIGGVLSGKSWGRPDDRVGLGFVVDGLSSAYRAFIAAGGQGIIIGDGQLTYRPEQVIEAYYLLALTDWAAFTLDYQFIVNPGYNAARGPVSIGAARMHVQF